MTELMEPNVGPIIGETTAGSVRLWGRGSKPKSPGRRVHGVVRVLGSENESTEVIFKMTKTWDYTGVGVIEGLKANKQYEYQFGYFHDSRDTSAIDIGQEALDWAVLPKYQFRTASDKSSDSRSFLLGSCRYNLPWADDDRDHTDTRGDKTFRAMLAQIDRRPANALIMLGDQIYSDILGVGVSSPEAFNRLYRGAFRQEGLRKLMQRLPTYMTLDDHEIEDNWPQGRSPHDYNKEVAAKYAYQAYQASHSPVLEHAHGRLQGLPEHFWYQFRDGCCEFFMLDVRTERNIKAGEIVSENQLEALTEFLKNGSGQVKIVGSAVPFILEGQRGHLERISRTAPPHIGLHPEEWRQKRPLRQRRRSFFRGCRTPMSPGSGVQDTVFCLFSFLLALPALGESEESRYRRFRFQSHL